ncbi:winged helix-turn-helix domain-containing protein [Pseudomonas sp. S1_G07]
MSSLKKYAFTPTLTAIALHDFTPNAELFHYDMNAQAADAHPQLNASDRPEAHLRLNTYFITHSLSLPSQGFNATRQESRASTPTPNAPDSPPDNRARTQEISTERPQLHPQDFWLLTQHDRTLVKGGLRISLTTIESALIKKMLHHEERVVSKEELIRNIGREPELYRGLEMCLSRLQEKFRRVNDGERLFRAVRNRGYCLTQKIKKPIELNQPRR